MEDGVSAALISTDDLVAMFEAAESATIDARRESERDRDYRDGKQYTSTELEALKERGQPPIVVNRIKPKIDFLCGYELSRRVDPRVTPRTPMHDADASSVQNVLKYVTDDQRYDRIRSMVWENLLIDGAGGVRVGVKPNRRGEIDVVLERVHWDRMFWDPHSAEQDFLDASYHGLVRWMDLSDALDEYPNGRDKLEWTMRNVALSDTYDDRPKHKVWADRKRERVRIVQIWFKRRGQWLWAEFTKGGILVGGPSPYVDENGESDCELVFGSSFLNRENERYGIVRQMVPLQDEVNKRRSKSLHYLNTNQIILEDGAVQDIQKFRKQAARPDGVLIVNRGFGDKIKMESRLDLSAGHQALMQEAKNELDMMGGNVALQGEAAQSAASGKAIIASQFGGAMEIAPMIDALMDIDARVYRKIWSRIRQFWNAEKWVRVTDDERNIKWVVLNADPMRLQMIAMQNPQLAQSIIGSIGNLSEIDVDITIDDGPDGITPQLEQFQSLVELKKMDANGEIPFRAVVAAMPNLRNREQVLAAMDEAKQSHGPPPEAQAAMVLELADKKAKVEKTQADTAKTHAEAIRTMQEAAMPRTQPLPQVRPGRSPLEEEGRARDLHASADLKQAQTAKTVQELQLAPIHLAQQARQAEMRDATRMNRPPPGR